MTKSELINVISAKTDLSHSDVRTVVDCMLDTITAKMVKGEDVTISGFGRFEVRSREAKNYTNPKTGEKQVLASTVTPGFKCSGNLKKTVKEGHGK